eukprot:CAMPEP_0175149192 /NCGR_PEP_ID=MMETSP0087-20121206/17093_1 /TAXON_ID=136419 /ORGANISM="Unknown Unknown, Strain D1" /LENGTH=184 /DNA_ID=CAMNT_0016434829 /DNA_START=272 /DNA_END=826 /DNA_ORIENTATION=+
MFIDIHPTIWPSNSAYRGQTLGAGVKGYAEFAWRWQRALKTLIESWNIPFLAPHHADAKALFADAEELEPNVRRSGTTIIISTYHRDHILKSTGVHSLLAGLQSDYLDLLLLNLIRATPSSFTTNAHTFRAYALAMATLTGQDDYMTGRFLAECERDRKSHNMRCPIELFSLPENQGAVSRGEI